jgi:hypothetical protein
MNCSCCGFKRQIGSYSSDERMEPHRVSRNETNRKSQFWPLYGFFVHFVILAVLLAAVTAEQNGDSVNKPDITRSSETSDLGESISQSTDNIDKAERSRLSRAQWKVALSEIKNLSVKLPEAPKSSASSERPGTGFLSQWKLLLDEPANNLSSNATRSDIDATGMEVKERRSWGSVRRFDGFPSWERTLQDWSDDVQEYLDKIEDERASTSYSLSGQPIPISASAASTVELVDANTRPEESSNESSEVLEEALKENLKEDVRANYTESVGSGGEVLRVRRNQLQMPVPASARPGEEVLPHTDIADKSKRIWIVTTASLPWMTGTAVNPLLRAAYMTAERKEAGGSVTLMLPWLERKQDQAQVYGADRGFDSPKQQEEYLRTWLRETANLVEASEDLNIKWYTAWQNKAENSLYSMGDITAMIPADDVDICILEEPEHLNWYVTGAAKRGTTFQEQTLKAHRMLMNLRFHCFSFPQVPSARGILDKQVQACRGHHSYKLLCICPRAACRVNPSM